MRNKKGISQSQLAKELDVTRSSVNDWEIGLSTPIAQYVVAMANCFHITTAYLLGVDSVSTISLAHYNDRQIKLIYDLLNYFDLQK